MALKKTDSCLQYTNDFLAKRYDVVSPDNGDGTIVQSQTGGGFDAGCITFTPNTDTNGGSYPLYIGSHFDADSQWVVQIYIEQTATQGTLGGRLLTFVDAPADVFGSTVQVAVNLMSDSTLQVTRAITAGSGIVLRGVDQGGDSQMELLGTGDAITGNGTLEVRVVFSDTVGTVGAWWTEDVADPVTVQVLDLSGINTAVSTLNQATDILEGGYGVTGPSDTTLHHEDLAAKLSNLVIINSAPVTGDPFAPTDRLGPQKPVMLLPTADDGSLQWTPNPVQDHYLNVNEVPPDEGTTENTAATATLRDSFTMQTATGTGEDQAHLAYTGYVTTDTAPECVSAAAANFEALVWMETTPGVCQTGPNDTSSCDLSNLVSRRGQSVCTIKSDGESVTFKPNVNPTGDGFDGFWVALSPLDNPPQVWNRAADLPGADIVLILDSNGQNIAVSPGQAEYTLPFYQPWLGYAYSLTPADGLASSGDYIQFSISGDGASFDIGLIDHPYNLVLDPYSPVAAAIHFREDIIDTPFFFCGENFTYNGESTFSYAEDDVFKILRQDPDIKIYQNAVLVATITPGVMPTFLYPYMLAGRWGFRNGSYSIPPAIYNAVAHIGVSPCIPAYFQYPAVEKSGTLSDGNYNEEYGQWGIGFTDFSGGNTAQVIDACPNPGESFFPTFDYDGNVTLTFVLVGGNVVLQIRNAVSVNSDGSPNFVTLDANNADFTYSRPYSQTDDFKWQPNVAPINQWYRVGLPVWPLQYLQADFINNTTHQADPNLPLRLMVMVAGDSDYALPYKAGVNSASFTFVAGENPTQYAGYISTGSDKDGNAVVAPTSYAYRQSMLSTDPDGNAITINSFNAAQGHGYTDPE